MSTSSDLLRRPGRGRSDALETGGAAARTRGPGRLGRLLAFLGGVLSVVLLTSFITFGLTSISPANPAATLAGPAATTADVHRLEHAMGLDRPFLTQYADWLGGVARGDFGRSYFSDTPVTHDIVNRLPVDLAITTVALLGACLYGFGAGILAATRRGTWVDRAITGISSLSFTVPEFWLGILLILFFAVRLGALPASGWVPLHQDPAQWLRHVILPGVALAIPVGATLARQLRTSLVAVYEQNYVTGAIVRGLGPRRILFRHALRNAAAPGIAAIGLTIPYLLSGAVVVEQVFSLPGLGQYAITGATSQDVPIIQGVLMVTIAIVIVSNVAVDFLLGWLRPGTRV